MYKKSQRSLSSADEFSLLAPTSHPIACSFLQISNFSLLIRVHSDASTRPVGRDLRGKLLDQHSSTHREW